MLEAAFVVRRKSGFATIPRKRSIDAANVIPTLIIAFRIELITKETDIL
jgi:hypothetical protein